MQTPRRFCSRSCECEVAWGEPCTGLAVWGLTVGRRAASPSAALGSSHSGSLIPDRLLLTPHPQHPLGFLGPGSRWAQGGSGGVEKRRAGLGVRRPERDPGADLRAVCLGGETPHRPESLSVPCECRLPSSAAVRKKLVCNLSSLKQTIFKIVVYAEPHKAGTMGRFQKIHSLALQIRRRFTKGSSSSSWFI